MQRCLMWDEGSLEPRIWFLTRTSNDAISQTCEVGCCEQYGRRVEGSSQLRV
jgi:hypothetical protein